MKDFLDFLQKRKLLTLFSILTIVIIYGYRLINVTIGIDTEMALADYAATQNWFIGCGRFFCAFLRKMIMPNHFNYHLAFVLAILFLIATQFVLMYAFYKYGMSQTFSSLLFVALFFSFPTFAEVFYFSNQSDIVAIGFFLSSVGALLVCEHVLFARNFKYLVTGIILGALSTGCYQALLFLFIAEILVFSILKVMFSKEAESFRQYLLYAVKLIAVIITVTLLYFAVSSIAKSMFYDPDWTYAGHTHAENYISSSVAWKKQTAAQCFTDIANYALKTIHPDHAFGSIVFAIVFGFNILLLAWIGIKERNIKYLYIFLLFAALGITPYLGAIVKGQGINLREQFILPFVFAFTTAFVYFLLKNSRYFKKLFVVLILYTSWCQISLTTELFHTDYLRYQFDHSTIEQITQTATANYGTLNDKVLVYYGMKTWPIPENQPHGETIGYSIFQWDCSKEWGTNYRINYFSKSLGLTTNIPTMDQIETGYQLADNLSPWPSPNSMAIDGNIIVVKLSE